MNFIYMLLSFLLGMAMTVQASVNGEIRFITENPVFAAFANFVVGTLASLFFMFIFLRRGTYQIPTLNDIKTTKWWMWVSGPIGASYVTVSVFLPPIIGFGAFFSMIVAGQLCFSATIDHIGWLGNAVSRIDKRRGLGIALLIIGAVLVQNF